MGLPSMFSTQASPIAIDFGSSSVKLLQIGGSGQRPNIVAAAELAIPDAIRMDQEQLQGYYAAHLPKILSAGRFRGKRAIIAVPSTQTFIQHMQLNPVEGVNRDELIKSQLQTKMGCPPDGVVVRSMDVTAVQREGQSRNELICFAMTRHIVMRYVELLRKCRLNTVGVHTEAMAMVRSFDHLNRRESDVDVTTLYVDMGWGGTCVAIAHGKQMVFARHIQIGGRHLDQLISKALHCDATDARAHRLSMEGPVASALRSSSAPASTAVEGNALLNAATAAAEASRTPASRAESKTATESDRRVGAVPAEFCQQVEEGPEPPTPPANVDLTELLGTIADELSMCRRYHHGLFPNRTIDRVIFLGGEARQVWMCQHIVKALRVPAQLGDPLARMEREGTPATPGLKLDQPQPGWAVPCGLCTSPTDL